MMSLNQINLEPFACLLVEDDLMVGRSMAKFLEGFGGEVAWCQSLKQAKAAMDDRDWDLFMLDQNLPDGYGTNLLEAVREAGNLTPTLLLSGEGLVDVSPAARSIGYLDVLSKPIRLAQLRDRIEQALDDGSETEMYFEEELCGCGY